MSQPTSGPDVQQLHRESLQQSAFPGGRQQSFRVFFAPEAYREIWSHARADTSVEICGVLVGRWEQDEAGPFVVVAASIRGRQAETKFAEVTFTHETWAAINSEMDTRFADQKIVGWYHTHPDFGIFLSDRDRFIHENFFSGAGQIALVVDPIRAIEGVFVWREGKPVTAPHYWVGNEVKTAPPEAASNGSNERGQAVAAETAGPSAAAAGLLAGWYKIVEPLIQYLLVFIVGYLLAGRLNDATLLRAQRVGSAFAVFQLGLRPGLEIRVEEMRKEAVFLIEKFRTLEDEYLASLKQHDAAAEVLDKALENRDVLDEHLDRLAALLSATENEYCLNREERDLLEQMLAARTVGRTGSTPPPAGAGQQTAPVEGQKSAKPAKPPASTDKSETPAPKSAD